MATSAEVLIWDQFASVSLKVVKGSARALLSRHLDPSLTTFSSSGYLQDWRGFAELFGLGSTDIQIIKERPMGEFTEQVLRRLDSADVTIGQLADHLKDMERYDVIEDELLMTTIGRDAASHLRLEEQRRHDAMVQEVRPVQDGTVSSFDGMAELGKEPLTCGSVDGQTEYFDAFVCYSTGDLFFVKQMIEQLENIRGFKLCLPGRDLLPGTHKYSAVAELIENRCRKVIILLSPEYLKCSECDFQTKFSQSLSQGFQSKKLVPVLIKPMASHKIPSVLRCLTPIDYTKCEVVDWFWRRLEGCLKEPTSPISGPVPIFRLNSRDVLNVSNHI